jgi:hypothetical protein
MRNPFKKLDEHADLMNRMGAATDADLSEAALGGRLDAERYRKALKACTHCKSVDTCLSWLEQHEATDGEKPPEFCANKELLLSLREERD